MSQHSEGLDANECAALRYLRAADWTLDTLETVFMVRRGTLVKHANGWCSHGRGPDPLMSDGEVIPSDEIRRHRVARGHTQASLADEVGVHRRAVTAWENGEYGPRGVNIERLVDTLPGLKVYLDEFRERDGRPEPTRR